MFIGLNDFQNRWYSSILLTMEELPLLWLAEDRNIEEIYRFTYLPSFSNPLSVRIEFTPNQEPSIRMISKLSHCEKGQPNGLQNHQVLALTLAQWQELQLSMENNFWTPRSWKENIGCDGEEWIFEGYRVGGIYKVLTAWSGRNDFAWNLGQTWSKLIPPQFGEFKDMCTSSLFYKYLREGDIDHAIYLISTWESIYGQTEAWLTIAEQY